MLNPAVREGVAQVGVAGLFVRARRLSLSPQTRRTATINVLKDHYMLPRDPALKGKYPAPFTAYAVPLK